MKHRINKIIAALLMSLCIHQSVGALHATESRLYIDAEFLYWQAHEDGIPFLADGTGTTAEGNLYEVDGNWDSGYRIGAGVLLGADPWDLSLTFTWYKNISSGDHFGASVGTFLEIPRGGATADWRLTFKTLDLTLQKDLFLFNNYVLTPIFSIRSAFIKDAYVIQDIRPAGTPPTNAHINVNNFQRLCGIGPRFGLATSWYLGDSLSLFAEADFSLLWAKHSLSRIDMRTTGVLPGSLIARIKHRFRTLRFVPEYRIGLQWDYSLTPDHFEGSFVIAWEEQLWRNYNQFLYSGDYFNRNTSLSLYGLTLGTQFVF